MTTTSRSRSILGQTLILVIALAIGLGLYLWLAPRTPVTAMPPATEGEP